MYDQELTMEQILIRKEISECLGIVKSWRLVILKSLWKIFDVLHYSFQSAVHIKYRILYTAFFCDYFNENLCLLYSVPYLPLSLHRGAPPLFIPFATGKWLNYSSENFLTAFPITDNWTIKTNARICFINTCASTEMET